MQTKINTLKSLLPSSPFVVEQVSYALKYAQESTVSEEVLEEVIDQAIYLTNLANEFSNPNFYAYRPIVCTLLSVVDDETKLDMFATETNSVLVTLAELKQFIAVFNENTNKACTLLAQAVINENEVVEIALAWMLNHLNKADQVDILKIAYICTNFRLSGFDFTGATYAVYDKLLNKLNKVDF